MLSSRAVDKFTPMNGVRFYCGATVADADKSMAVVEALEIQGMINTYNWAKIGAVDLDRYVEVSAKEIQGVLDAPICIFLLPGKFGMQTELGAALAAKALQPRRRVIMWSKDEVLLKTGHQILDPTSQQIQSINIFWHHPSIEHVIGADPVDSILTYLFN
jgi:hypothetical protein